MKSSKTCVTIQVTEQMFCKNTKERIKIINIYGESTKWKNGLSEDDLKVCVDCDKEHGHIYHLSVPDKVIKLKVWHPHCRCFVDRKSVV